MSEVRVKKRTGKPKSRGGCTTCKIRHVKCDETRPQCLRCVKFEIECDGYEIRKKETRAQRSTAPVLLPKLAGNQPLMPPSLIRLSDGTRLLPTATPFQPSTRLHFEKQSELLYFMTFQDRAAAELSGYFDTNIWKRTFLQLCHEEEFARHGIIAIGALHTAMELIQGNGGVLASSKTQRKLGEHHHCIALQHYAKALKLMRDLPDRAGHAWLRHILLSCLLTACFENYIGNIESSMKAAQMGVDILIERGSPGEQGKSEEDLSHIIHNRSLDINDLLATFARLESYIMMFANARGGHRRLRLSQVEGLASFREIPERFKTVQEARMHTDFFVKHALTWRDILLQLSNYSTLDIAEPDPAVRAKKIEELSQRAKTEFGICVKTKQKWIKAFEPVYKASRASPGSKEYLGASILMIQYISSNLMTHLPGQNSEVIFDRMILDHIKVVNLAQDLLENYPCSSSKKAVFTFDDGFVPALFLVGTRCRDRTVRRQAIRMMIDYPRREALWDSTVAASIAVWLMNKEEEGIVDGYVPESSRLRISKMDVRYTEKKAIIGYSKWDEASKQRIEMGDVEFRWQGADNRNLETFPTLSTIN